MAETLSEYREELGNQLGRYQPNFPVFIRSTQGNLHHKCYREPEQHLPAAEQTKECIPSDTALLKALYLATFEAAKKGPCRYETEVRYMGRCPLCMTADFPNSKKQMVGQE